MLVDLRIDGIGHSSHGDTQTTAQGSNLSGEDLSSDQLTHGNNTQSVSNKHGDHCQQRNIAEVLFDGSVQTTVGCSHVGDGGDGKGGGEDDHGGEDEQVSPGGVAENECRKASSDHSDGGDYDRSKVRINGGAGLLEDVGHVEHHGGDPGQLGQEVEHSCAGEGGEEGA